MPVPDQSGELKVRTHAVGRAFVPLPGSGSGAPLVRDWRGTT